MKIIGSYPNLRLRRLRKSTWIRDLVSESNISHKDLILPIFIREGKNKVESKIDTITTLWIGNMLGLRKLV